MQATKAEASVLSLRTMQDTLAVQVPGTIEAGADAISAQATDAKTKRRALLWKIELVPTFYQALFDADPLAAVLDTLVLCFQLQAYYQTGPGREEFGTQQPLAQKAVQDAAGQVEAAAKAVAKSPEGLERAVAFSRNWATAHPILGPLSSRPSVLGHLADMATGKAEDVSVFQVVGDLPATVDDLATRLDIYTAYVPRATRWQVELMAYELDDRAEAQHILETFASVRLIADRLNELVSKEALQYALDAATAKVSQERLVALANVDRLRQEAQAFVTAERLAALQGLGAERQAAMAEVDRQRVALLQDIEVLRKQAMLDANELATRIIWRGAFAAAGLLLLAAVLTTLVVRFGLRYRP